MALNMYLARKNNSRSEAYMELLPVKWFDKLDSTNTYLKHALHSPGRPRNGTVIAAKEQTAGRGRNSRIWSQAPGQDIAMSIFMNLDICPMKILPLPLIMGLAVKQILENYGVHARLKWPNDLLVMGHKICGILMETQTAPDKTLDVIVGIGLNVNMTEDQAGQIDKPATSMRIVTGEKFDVTEVLENMVASVNYYVNCWLEKGFEELRKQWLVSTDDIGAPVSVEQVGHPRLVGAIASIGDRGQLVIKNPAGQLQEVWAGDVCRI